VAQTTFAAVTVEQSDLPTKPPSEAQGSQWARLQVPPVNSARQRAESDPRAKHITWPEIPVGVQVGSVVGTPPKLRKPCHEVPLKRLASTGCVLLVVLREFTAQTTPPAPSPAQPGAEMVVAARLPNALHAVPLKALQVSPPVKLRATQTSFPALKEAQLGAEVSWPPTEAGVLQVVPLKTVTMSELVALRAAQKTLLLPSLVQLGAE